VGEAQIFVLGAMTVANCANCGSSLLQLEAWKEGHQGAMTLRLRCPECFVRIVGDFDAHQVARLDRALAEARLEMIALYDAVVCENLGHEAALMARALALDLIGADDFAARTA
jgi:DNA-directed RNA polymerase subunit RPC12/RpoP